jgi:glycosyltransferase involved in cell wall biosynthesis
MAFVSVLNWCYSRQEMLDITLPLWLKQEGVDFEIVLGVGPDIKVPDDPRIVIVPTPTIKLVEAYNIILSKAKGDLCLITQSDIQVNSPTQIKRMVDKWNGHNVITELFFKKGARDSGMYMQCCLVAKKELEKIGGWCEGYGCPALAAHEDGDIMASFLENGLDLDHTETPADEGVYHIDHPMPDYVSDPVMLTRLANARELFWSRHKKGVMELYARQAVRRVMGRRINA